MATPSRKRRGSKVFNVEKDILEFIPLGAGKEVGRSCHILKFKGKTIMLDCGIHPAYTGVGALPFFDEIEPSEIDILLITHFHLDHAASLPYFLAHTDFKGRVFMTHPTKSIYKLILQDYIKVSTISVEDTLYTEEDLFNSMDRIEVINYHQVVHHNGIKFWCYNAGHVLGAAMFMIEIAGVKILYTGDYSRREDRHLMSAETPEVKPDVLIVEATYGTQALPPVQKREKRFCDLVTEIVSRRGRCLIPVFALGRAQELLLILDEYWEANPGLQKIPIYYASVLAKKCMTVYQTYINMMNNRIQKQSQVSNPFIFKHIVNLKGMDHFDDSGPCVVMASPGMLQNGLSRELFELWCSDKRNGVIIPGYCVEGTLAKQIMLEPSHIETLSGLNVPLRMSVYYVSFSAHADYRETSEFIEILKPGHVILVHGAPNEMGRLKTDLDRKYSDGSIRVWAPENCQSLELEFRAQKIAKVVGSLADEAPVDGSILSGLVVRKDFKYQILDTTDLATFTPLVSTVVNQTLKVPYHQAWSSVVHFVGQMYDVVSSKERLVTALQGKEAEKEGEKADRMDGDAAEATPVKEEKTEGKGNGDNTNDNTKHVDNGSSSKSAESSTENINNNNSSGSSRSNDSGTNRAKSNSKKKDEQEEDEKDRFNRWVLPEVPYVFVHDAVMISKTGNDHVTLEWKSNPINDMIADSIVALMMTIQANPGAAKAFGYTSCGHAHAHAHDGDASSPIQVVGTDGDVKVVAEKSSSAVKLEGESSVDEDIEKPSEADAEKETMKGKGDGMQKEGDISATVSKEDAEEIMWFLSQHYGEKVLVKQEETTQDWYLEFVLRGHTVVIRSRPTWHATCESNSAIQTRVTKALIRITSVLFPLTQESTSSFQSVVPV